MSLTFLLRGTRKLPYALSKTLGCVEGSHLAQYRSKICVICDESGSKKVNVIVPTVRMLQLLGRLAEAARGASQPPETSKNRKLFEWVQRRKACAGPPPPKGTGGGC